MTIANLKQYDISGRYDCDGDEIPPIIKESENGKWMLTSDVKDYMISRAEIKHYLECNNNSIEKIKTFLKK